jgi:hypothetical protein
MLEDGYAHLMKQQRYTRSWSTAAWSEQEASDSAHMPDLHFYLPKLNTKGTLFKASAATMEQRASEYCALVDALLSDDAPPVLCTLREDRLIRDFFGYWLRDDDFAKKARGSLTSASLSAPLVHRGARSSSPRSLPHGPEALFDRSMEFGPSRPQSLLHSAASHSTPSSCWSLCVEPRDSDSICTLAVSPRGPPTIIQAYRRYPDKLTLDNPFLMAHSGHECSDLDLPSPFPQSLPAQRLPLRRPLPAIPLPSKLAAELAYRPDISYTKPVPGCPVDLPAHDAPLSAPSDADDSVYEAPPAYGQTDQHQLLARAPVANATIWASAAPLVPRRPVHS